MNRLSVDLQNEAPIPLQAAFDCAPGELTALVGPSGSGKTSLLRAVSGLLRGSSLRGHVRLGDWPWFDSEQGINLTPQQRQVGLVFQNYALFPHLSAFDNVALAAGAALNAEAVTALLGRLGLAGLESRRPSALSGGQQQRVALARALARVAAPGPGALLLDEPFSAVDAPTRQALYQELTRLRQDLSMPMVLVTHDLAEARRLADRVVILDAGSTLQAGTPAQVFSSPRNARVAELVGIQNLFKGRFFKDRPGFGRLSWGRPGQELSLRIVDKNRLDNGIEVSWVLAVELIDLLADAAPDALTDPGPGIAGGPGANRLRCQIREIVSLGEISLCRLNVTDVPDQQITLNLSGALLRKLGAAPGSWLQLIVPPAAVHIMPTRT